MPEKKDQGLIESAEVKSIENNLSQWHLFVKKIRRLRENFRRLKKLSIIQKSAKQPELLWQVMSTGTKDVYPQDTINLINKLCSYNGDIPMSVVAVLFLPPERALSTQEAAGVVFFTALIEEVDELLDKRLVVITGNPEELRNNLLDASIDLPGETISMQEILNACLACFSDEKQMVIQQFLTEMIVLHSESGVHAYPGSYSLLDALEYKEKSSVKYARVASTLANSPIVNSASFTSIILLSQFLDDAGDWQKDAQEGSRNLLWGVAYDLRKQGDSGFDFMIQLEEGNRDRTIPTSELFKYKQLRNVRNQYLLKIRELNLQSMKFPYREAALHYTRWKLKL